MQSGFVVQYPLQSLPELTHINEAVCEPHYRLAWHTHPGYEFHYLLQGELVWEFSGGERLPQKNGQLFIIPPRAKHRLASRPLRPKPFHIFSMGLAFQEWMETRPRLQTAIERQLKEPVRSFYDFEPLMRSIFRYCLRKQESMASVVHAHLDVFLLQLEEQVFQPWEEEPTFGPSSYAVEKALLFMEETLDRKISLKELAGMAHLAPSHFAHRFKEEVGQSPIAHHLNLRLTAAQRALREPGSDLTEIALRYGFGSVQHFSLRFREKYGDSPGRWRNRERNNYPHPVAL